MSEEDKEYLRRNNIHQLLDQLAKDIIDEKPDNPQLFVVDWLKKKEDEEDAAAGGAAAAPAGDAGGGVGGRRRSKPAMISVPETPQKVSAATLKEWLSGGGSGCVVVDVRPFDDDKPPAGGRIKGSESIPCDTVVQDAAGHAQRWQGKEAVVFVSMQSPDLDLTAGMPVMQALVDSGSQAQVYILSGGIYQWVREYHGDAALVEDYDAAKWEKIFAAAQGAGD
eukprot:TRINITY_DN69964_c0_g1_i1.p1 TRINITY_DN69964_c0_g1~~TRINITY_DN69964_c0_g1_i1.p1  ORF type:complete len:223 (+),score=62.97 TRINITY_DN69964_c0_g1_i1:92-760(+)